MPSLEINNRSPSEILKGILPKYVAAILG